MANRKRPNDERPKVVRWPQKKESTSSNYRRFVRRPEMRTLIQSKAILLSYSPLIGFAILAPAVVAVVFVVVVVVDVVG